jgi:hypothetical protein
MLLLCYFFPRNIAVSHHFYSVHCGLSNTRRFGWGIFLHHSQKQHSISRAGVWARAKWIMLYASFLRCNRWATGAGVRPGDLPNKVHCMTPQPWLGLGANLMTLNAITRHRENHWVQTIQSSRSSISTTCISNHPSLGKPFRRLRAWNKRSGQCSMGRSSRYDNTH